MSHVPLVTHGPLVSGLSTGGVLKNKGNYFELFSYKVVLFFHHWRSI